MTSDEKKNVFNHYNDDQRQKNVGSPDNIVTVIIVPLDGKNRGLQQHTFDNSKPFIKFGRNL